MKRTKKDGKNYFNNWKEEEKYKNSLTA